ncbi:MAG: iron complex outerrane recepter protein [Bacteroidales bacterium]|jgi:hemoglobin/transferrin/lactoferrin receptor protein|nr:iron complex outerrane recepter protein [Bacteroidales bacterium]
MLKKYFGLLFISTLCYNLNAQTVKVVEKKSGAPIEFVTISTISPKLSSLTNESGLADVSMFRELDSIYFTSIGFETRIISWDQMKQHDFVIGLKALNYSLDEVIVSATRWAQSRRELTSRVTSIRGPEIQISNPQTAADLLAASGEVFIQKSQQGGGSPMIRGFATNRLLISVDGVRMNNAIFRSGNIQNIINIDPFMIDQAEVLYGPGSVMYGSDAIGGVMNFSTLKPFFAHDDKIVVNGSAATRFSSANNEITSHVHIKLGSQKLASVTSFTFNRFGDLRMGSRGSDFYLRKEYVKRINDIDVVFQNEDQQLQVPSGFEMGHFMQKLSFQPTERWFFEYGLIYSNTTNYSRYDRLLRYKNGLPRSAEWYYGPQKWLVNRFTITHTRQRILFDEIMLNLSAQQFEESRHDRDFMGSVLYERFEKVNAYALNLDLRKSFNEQSRLLYGAEIVFNDVASTGTDRDIFTDISEKGPARYPQSDWLSAALFATYQYELSDKSMVQAGVRYNYFSMNATFDTTFYKFPFETAENQDGALTGSLGFNYRPNESWIVRAGVSTGFRAPNVDDIGKVFDSEPGAVVVPNPDLKPEYAYNAEIDMARVFSDRVKIDISAFYTLLDQAMVRRDFLFNGLDSIMYDGELSKVQAIQNAAKATVYGLQIAAEWKMDNGFSLFSHLTWQKGEEELDDGSKSPLRHSAPVFGITRLSYMHSGLRFDLYGQYSQKVSYKDMPESEISKDYLYPADNNGNPYAPGWYTLNFKAMKRINEMFTFSGGIENITDQRYMPYSSGLVASGRNFIFSLRMNF